NRPSPACTPGSAPDAPRRSSSSPWTAAATRPRSPPTSTRSARTSAACSARSPTATSGTRCSCSAAADRRPAAALSAEKRSEEVDVTPGLVPVLGQPAPPEVRAPRPVALLERRVVHEETELLLPASRERQRE